jgi:membrane-associated phospholipid phosphatase
MPSSHASAATSFAALTNRNLDSIDMSPRARKVLQYSATTVSGLTAWARIESREHYPSDVLVGAALGHFITTVLHDSMMGLDTPLQVGVKLDGDSGGMLTFHMPF